MRKRRVFWTATGFTGNKIRRRWTKGSERHELMQLDRDIELERRADAWRNKQ